jgi:ubiquinone/menaquinone biosynthesis C-methylase UbiE
MTIEPSMKKTRVRSVPERLAGVAGRSFGRVADEYDRSRPEYPDEAVDHVVRELGLRPSATVLDLGAGTGKLTRALQARFAHVIAVEPDDAMRARIAGDVRSGSAEVIPVEDAGVDAVFVGDAFHWFDAPIAVPEIRRVLRAGGGIALLWNEFQAPKSGEARELLDEVWRRFHGDTSFESTWIDVAEREFGRFRRARFERELTIDGDTYTDLCITGSCPSALPDDDRAELRRRLRACLADEYRLPVPTEVWWVQPGADRPESTAR